MKKFNKHMKNEKGLTLIELLAVIVILAIIAAIAVPAIGSIINNSRDKALLADASNILAGAKIALIDGECKATADACSQTELKNYVDNVKAKSPGGNAVTYSAAKTDGKWSVSYSALSELKNTKYSEVKKATVTEDELNAALQK